METVIRQHHKGDRHIALINCNLVVTVPGKGNGNPPCVHVRSVSLFVKSDSFLPCYSVGTCTYQRRLNDKLPSDKPD